MMSASSRSQKIAQIGIIIEFTALIRCLGEYFRLKYFAGGFLDRSHRGIPHRSTGVRGHRNPLLFWRELQNDCGNRCRKYSGFPCPAIHSALRNSKIEIGSSKVEVEGQAYGRSLARRSSAAARVSSFLQQVKRSCEAPSRALS